MGWSDGCSLALGAAAHRTAVAAVAAYGPSVWPLMREDDLARFGAVMQQLAEATADDRSQIVCVSGGPGLKEIDCEHDQE